MEISENARVWIYQSNRELSDAEVKTAEEKLNQFVNQWDAHGKKLTAKGEIRYNTFIILLVDETLVPVSGCSLDKATHFIQQLEQEFNINLLDRFNIAYRDGNEIITCDRLEFEKLIEEGKVTRDTIVFNNLVLTKQDLDKNWQIPLNDSWHAGIFNKV